MVVYRTSSERWRSGIDSKLGNSFIFVLYSFSFLLFYLVSWIFFNNSFGLGFGVGSWARASSSCISARSGLCPLRAWKRQWLLFEMASTVTNIIGPLRKENCCSDRSICLLTSLPIADETIEHMYLTKEIPPTHSSEEDALSGVLTHLWCAARSPHISGRRTSLPPGSCYTHIVPSPRHRWCLVGFGLRDSCNLGKAPKQAIQLVYDKRFLHRQKV